jgi:hypothetical protein
MLTAFVGLGAAPVFILIRYEEMVRFHALPAVRGRTRSGTPDSASGLALAVSRPRPALTLESARATKARRC